MSQSIGWRQGNGNMSNQESKFDFLATHQCLVKIDKEQKIKIVRTNQQSNLQASCQSIFSLPWHHPSQSTVCLQQMCNYLAFPKAILVIVGLRQLEQAQHISPICVDSTFPALNNKLFFLEWRDWPLSWRQN